MSDEIIRIALDDSEPGLNFRFLEAGLCIGYRWKRFGFISNIRFVGPNMTSGNFGVNATPQAYKYIDGVTHLGIILGVALGFTGFMFNLNFLFGARDEVFLARIEQQRAEQAERVRQFAIARLAPSALQQVAEMPLSPPPSGTGERGGFK